MDVAENPEPGIGLLNPSRNTVIRIGTRNAVTSWVYAGFNEIRGGVIEVTPDVTARQLNTLISQLLFYVNPGDVGYEGTAIDATILEAGLFEKTATRTQTSPQTGALIDSYQRLLPGAE